ncbi:MAG: hypothetical protein HY255_01930 [Betaproteobacteria bacterium]|nr:hypothetical protein [Betaproteobacteria bacterium]
MAKAEIGWRRETPEGERLDVYAQHVGRRWIFYARHRRYDPWQEVKHPPLVDWLELLDALRRLVVRRRHPPDEIDRVIKTIRERFPESAVK